MNIYVISWNPNFINKFQRCVYDSIIKIFFQFSKTATYSKSIIIKKQMKLFVLVLYKQNIKQLLY